jgi:GNAT superfamily N-acetyltransferase
VLKTLPAAQLKIRPARPNDAGRIAVLSGQLGYPATAQQIMRRLARLRAADKHALFVAESAGEVIGWLHVSVTPLIESDLRGEVNGLIVADGQRSLGAGARLLRAAEEWARRRKCKSMSVRSNVIRERAHVFYLRNGYEHHKTQKTFRKAL